MTHSDAKLLSFLGLLARAEATFDDAERRVLRLDDGVALRRQVVNADLLRQVLAEGLAGVAGTTLVLTAADFRGFTADRRR